MARRYQFLTGQEDEQGSWTFDPKSTGAKIELAHPDCAKPADQVSQIVWNKAQKIAKDGLESEGLGEGYEGLKEEAEYRLLFLLARHLMSCLKGELRWSSTTPKRLAPFAVLFAEALKHLKRYPETGEQLD